MLHKAWPHELNVESDLSGKKEREILLFHLLTWSTWPGLLKFISKCFISDRCMILIQHLFNVKFFVIRWRWMDDLDRFLNLCLSFVKCLLLLFNQAAMLLAKRGWQSKATVKWWLFMQNHVWTVWWNQCVMVVLQLKHFTCCRIIRRNI